MLKLQFIQSRRQIKNLKSHKKGDTILSITLTLDTQASRLAHPFL